MEEKKYRIRKMWFVCTNNQVISPNVAMTNAYQFKNNAEQVAKIRSEGFIWEDK